MQITRLLAQLTVSDLAAAEDRYTRMFGEPPTTRPMDGLLEWHLDATFGVQVYEDADRAGRSTVVCEVADLDAVATQLDDAGIDRPEIVDVTASRALQVPDPDGNLVVFTGP